MKLVPGGEIAFVGFGVGEWLRVRPLIGLAFASRPLPLRGRG